MAKSGMRLPKQIFARVERRDDGDDVVAHETAEPFDEQGPVGRYELVEEGEVSVENSFLPKNRDGDMRRRRA